MAKINIIAIEYQKNQLIEQLEKDYIKRISTWHISTILLSPKISNRTDLNKLKSIESSLLLENCKLGINIALDSSGQMFTSEEFAQYFKNILQEEKSLNFIIGGHEGHSKELLNKANKVLSLSKLTFPHKLARLFLIEQIYRTYSILHHHPYHK